MPKNCAKLGRIAIVQVCATMRPATDLKSWNEAVLTSSAAQLSATVLRLVGALHAELEGMQLELLARVRSPLVCLLESTRSGTSVVRVAVHM